MENRHSRDDTHIVVVGERWQSKLAGHFGLSRAEINEVSMGQGENSLLHRGGKSKAEKGS